MKRIGIGLSAVPCRVGDLLGENPDKLGLAGVEQVMSETINKKTDCSEFRFIREHKKEKNFVFVCRHEPLYIRVATELAVLAEFYFKIKVGVEVNDYPFDLDADFLGEVGEVREYNAPPDNIIYGGYHQRDLEPRWR